MDLSLQYMDFEQKFQTNNFFTFICFSDLLIFLFTEINPPCQIATWFHITVMWYICTEN